MSQHTWTPCAQALPDSDTTVMIANPIWPSEPVWMGYHDGEIWRNVDGYPYRWDAGKADAPPTHWMQVPLGPVTDGQRIVLVLNGMADGKTVRWVSEFEPDRGGLDDTSAGRLFAHILKTVTHELELGSGAQQAVTTEEGR